jgi:hypothetical protein
MKRWMWVVLGIVAFSFVGCLGAIGGLAWVVSQHVQVKQMSSGDIESEFKALRGKFKDQKPLLDTRNGITIASERLEARAASYSGPLPSNLCILAWEKGDPQRVRVCLPFWLLKLKSGKGLKFDVPDSGIGRVEISAQELERAGPALLLDRLESRTHLMMWTE